MTLNPDDRVQQIYNAVLANNPTLGNAKKVSQAERDQVKAQLAALFATDTTYLLKNTVVRPGTMAAAAGAAVTVTTSTGPAAGSVTATSPVSTGTGTIL